MTEKQIFVNSEYVESPQTRNFTHEELTYNPDNPHTLKPTQIADIALWLQRGANEASARAEEANNLAERDPLTGLLNRRGLARAAVKLDESLTPVFAMEQRTRSLRYAGILTLMVDIEKFKSFNESDGGHKLGDVVLQACAELFEASIRREEDVVCRWGGDEFVILMPLKRVENANEQLTIFKERLDNKRQEAMNRAGSVGKIYKQAALTLLGFHIKSVVYTPDGEYESLVEAIAAADPKIKK